ncbi:MAG: alanine--tRNA ligase [Nitrospirae bacterium]|nr:alanine--tRNA ligase [Nitrospirota bacterium]
MKSSEIRKTFIEYFKSKGHEVVASASLVPRGDPTLLFTNAGMVRFKPVFLGDEESPYKRAVSCQKCLRAGGKHSDIENVGHTKRHHTFFEMLGNFSFGDYFKEKAIEYAWELLTGVFQISKDKLYVSIYEEDDEAERLWQEKTGLSLSRIVRLSAKDNFWQMADTGPCGPCSEIIIDQGPDAGCGKETCKVGCDCDRFLELWNLVFMQFNRDEFGTLTPLPKPSIDTGMGIERISAVLQGKNNNFDSDIFKEIISSIEANTGVTYGESPDTDASIRVIADHIRAISFLIVEGIMPSNEGRGYVLRRILRRAGRHARLLGKEGPLLYRLTDPVVTSLKGVYPELEEERETVVKVIRFEEERFGKTLEQGMLLMDSLIGSLRASKKTIIPGQEVFRLYDTYGFPLDLARDIAMDLGFSIDEDGFHMAMSIQRERARASWVGEETALSSIYRELISETGKTEFLGYETTESDAVIKAILKAGNVVKELSVGEEGEVFLNKTTFYGESGGQIGDTGVIYSDTFKADVLDTKSPLDSFISHHIKLRKGTLQVWMKVRCSVDIDKRHAIMRNHTATHLLQSALRATLGEHVKQAGSFVGSDRLRFDFTHFSSLGRDELNVVEDMVNSWILQNHPVNVLEMDIKDALSSGAIALFGERYGERVRTITVPGVSMELCGGTHVRATGDIGAFRILGEGSVSSGIRRIEAITGKQTIAYMREKEDELLKIALLVKSPDAPLEKVRALIEELRELQKEKEKAKGVAVKDISTEVVKKAREISGIKVVSEKVDGLSQKDLRALADSIRDRLGSCVIVLASVTDNQASFLSMVTGDLTKKLSADKILREVAKMTGGRGGGKPELAQGGTKDINALDTAINRVYDIVKTVKS